VNGSRRALLGLMAVSWLSVSACAARRAPVYIDPHLAEHPIQTVALAPIRDVRTDPFRDVQVSSYVRHGVENALIRKHYHVVSTRQAPSDTGVRTAADLSPMTDEQLAALAPADVPYVLAVTVDGVSTSRQDLGDAKQVKVSGRLLQVPSGRVVWRDVAEGGPVLTGLLGIFRGTATTLEGAYDASHLLISTLPDQAPMHEPPEPVAVSETPEAPGGLRPSPTR